MWKECMAILLPTKEKSNLILEENHLVYCKEPRLAVINGAYNQFLYIVSLDEDLKIGDWYYSKGLNNIFQATVHPLACKDARRIIATTDFLTVEKDVLIAQFDVQLPEISQEFIKEYIEEYNRGNILDRVQVEYYPADEEWNDETGSYEVSEALKIDTNNFISIKREKKSFTKEEVINLIQNAINYGVDNNGNLSDNWIKENL